MKPIPDTDLTQLVTEASAELITEQRIEVRGKVRAIFSRVHALSGDIKMKENELTKARKKLESAQARIEKLKAGDWTVLDQQEEKD